MPAQPNRREQAIWQDGYKAGYREGYGDAKRTVQRDIGLDFGEYKDPEHAARYIGRPERRKPKRKLSAWNKFVKANSKKPRFRMRSGKLNLKKMAVAFRRQRKR